MSSKELYIGNLDPDTKSQEMKDIFEQYGKVNRCEVKFGVSVYSVAFGFIAFESSRDAESIIFYFVLFCLDHNKFSPFGVSVSDTTSPIYFHHRGSVKTATFSSSFLISPCHPVIHRQSSSFVDEFSTRAQRKEHGRSHRGRRLIVEFSKTTPGQNRQRSQYSVGNERMNNGNSNGRNRSRSHDRNNSKSRRRRSPSYSQRSSIDRISTDNHRRKRDRSSLSNDYKSSSKQHRSFSNHSKHHISYSSKTENSDKQ
ncbi:unnamed protein product [Rotaria socialis]